MKDKLTNGFVQGLIAGAVANIADFILVSWLKFGKLLYLDYAGVHICGFKPGTLGEKIFALLVQLIFSGCVGILFVYWIDAVRRRNIFFKGILFGVVTWFLIYAITILYRLKPLDKIDLASAMESCVAAIIFGAVLAMAYHLLSYKIEIDS